MLGRTYETEICSAARALEIVGERWSLLILRNAVFAGMTRFSDFQRSLAIAPNILTKRLDHFVKEGLMTTAKGDSAADRREYHLTAKGLDLVPVIAALRQWGDRWEAPLGPPAIVEHQDCGGRAELVFRCTRCGKQPKPDEISARPTKAFAAYAKAMEKLKRAD